MRKIESPLTMGEVAVRLSIVQSLCSYGFSIYISDATAGEFCYLHRTDGKDVAPLLNFDLLHSQQTLNLRESMVRPSTRTWRPWHAPVVPTTTKSPRTIHWIPMKILLLLKMVRTMNSTCRS